MSIHRLLGTKGKGGGGERVSNSTQYNFPLLLAQYTTMNSNTGEY